MQFENPATHAKSIESIARKTILIVGSKDTVPECLVYAIEREFPSVVVHQTPTLDMATAPLEQPACIILIDATLLGDLLNARACLAHAHGPVPLALLQVDGRDEPPLQQIIASKVVRGVLPMDMKLDVWLLALRLILCGGQYFPATMFFAAAAAPVYNEVRLAPRVRSAVDADSDTGGLDELTERELQILSMVAKGQQNKMVAATLGLSEFTVKIHLHHIIRKLGAHNRTGAAAIYHARGMADVASPVRAPISRTALVQA